MLSSQIADSERSPLSVREVNGKHRWAGSGRPCGLWGWPVDPQTGLLLVRLGGGCRCPG